MPRPFWRSLIRSLIPHQYVMSVYDLDLHDLRARGVRGLILDLDNTLAAWRFGQPEPRLAEWVEGAKARGFSLYIVSNDLGPRVDLFSRFLGIPGVARAGKPRRRAFRRAIRALGLEPGEVAVVGDQVFTDILGARPLGCHTVLVVPVSRREFVGTRLVRRLEGLLLRHLAARGLLDGPVGPASGRGRSDRPSEGLTDGEAGGRPADSARGGGPPDGGDFSC
ncbi:MAG: YqeG family HAD IIIA-type phosphatase [Bacillota bacterium]